MTQGSTPPPIPAIPVYSNNPDYWPGQARRPGMISAIGVCSIVIGALAMFANGGMVMNALILEVASSMQYHMPQPPLAPMPGEATIVVGDEFLPENGMTAEARKRMIDALDALQPMSADRRDHLDALLQENGQLLFGQDPLPTSVSGFGEMITDHGQLPGLGGRAGRHYFQMKLGRLEVDDDQAVFYGPGQAIRGRRLRTTAVTAGPGAPFVGTGGTSLSAAQRQVVIEAIQQQAAPDRLNDKQVEAVESALASAWQMIVMPSDSAAAVRDAVDSVAVDADGTATIRTDISQIVVTPGGVAYESSMVVGKAQGADLPQPSRFLMGAAVGEAVLSGLLGVGLLVLGIMTLRQSSVAQRGHRIYVWIKIPLAIGGGLAWGAYYVNAMDSFLNPTASATPKWVLLMIAGIYAAMGLAYPVFLLFALRTKSVRAYYSSQ